MKTSRAILVVEDHKDSAAILGRVLSNFGHFVRIAHNIAEAKTLASQNHFDLVICDLGLPDGDGCGLMRDLASQYGLKGVALSGHGMEDDVARAMDAGFSSHVLKPVAINRLLEALDGVAGNSTSSWKSSGIPENTEPGSHRPL
jgi:CheY-like chemotaxis protein